MEFSKRSNLRNPMQNAGCCSKLTFWWLNGLFKKGYDRRLEPDDLYEVLNQDSSERLTTELEGKWKDEVRRQQLPSHNGQPSLWKPMLKFIKWSIIITGITGFLNEACHMAEAFFLLFLVSYFSPESSISKFSAYMCAGGLTLVTLSAVFFHSGYYFIGRRAGMKLRVALTGMIYRKVLKLSSTLQDSITTGHVMNLISTDAQKLDECLLLTHHLWIGPLQLIITTYILWKLLGPSCLVGISLSLLLVPFQTWLGHVFGKLRHKTTRLSDQRCSLMNEIISGIRVIKMFAWEKPYSELVYQVRRKEVTKLLKSAYIKAADRGIEFASHGLMSFFMFTTYVMVGNTLTASTVFTSLALLNRLIVTMGKHFPWGIKRISIVRISVKRIQEFLEFDELRNKKLTKATPKKASDKGIAVNGIIATWDDKNASSPTLDNISFEIRKGELLMVIGPVGSGKSSLLMSILGELPLTKGDITIKGKIGYASQTPWVFSGTVKQNILFGQKLIESRYKRVIRACALEKDIELMPEGDLTLVGDRGVSLSGGQKSRISLARVVYYNADIYLLDDPLSAVDTRVGRYLFDECFNGLLKDCPRILVTHQLQFVQNATQIVCLKEGKVLGIGTYTEIVSSGIDLITLIKHSKPLDDGSVDSAIDEEESSETTLLLVPEPNDEKSSSTKALYRRSLSSSTDIQLDLENPAEESQMSHEVDIEPENRLRGNIPIRCYTRLFSAGANCCVLMFLILLFFATQATYTLGDWWLAHWSDINARYTAEQHHISKLAANSTHTLHGVVYNQFFCIYVYLGLAIATLLLSVCKTFLFFYVQVNASKNLHNQMYDTVIKVSTYFFDTNTVGRIMNRFSKDIGYMDDLLPETFYEFLHLSFVIIAIVIVNVVSIPWILFGIVPLVIAFWCFRIYYLKTARELKRLEAIGRSPVFTHFMSTLEGISTIRSLSCQTMLSKELSTCQDHHTESWFLFVSASRWFSYRLEFLCFLFVAMATFTPLFIAEKQEIDEGIVGLALTYAIVLSGMFQWCVRLSAEVENQMTSVERVFEYCSLEPEGKWKESTSELPSSWPEHGIITAEKLSLQYHPTLPRALKNMYFCIRAKEKVGIVGRTGAGKSSLMAALLRLAEPSGRLLIDGIDVTDIGLHDLRTKISVIPQDPVLFGATLRYNLDPFNEYSDKEISEALNEVQLGCLVSELPDALDTMISESGSNFSVGQRQLICLSRALLRRNTILIIDEATAHVDIRTDSLIQDTIRKKFKDCTVLTIAHRLNSIIDCERVMILDNGRLVEFSDPYLLLLDKNSMFSKLVDKTGKANATRLLQLAKQSFDEQHQPNPLDHVPDHLRSNLEAFLPSSGCSALQIESTL